MRFEPATRLEYVIARGAPPSNPSSEGLWAIEEGPSFGSSAISPRKRLLSSSRKRAVCVRMSSEMKCPGGVGSGSSWFFSSAVPAERDAAEISDL
jgi:hypothetical protein